MRLAGKVETEAAGRAVALLDQLEDCLQELRDVLSELTDEGETDEPRPPG